MLLIILGALVGFIISIVSCYDDLYDLGDYLLCGFGGVCGALVGLIFALIFGTGYDGTPLRAALKPFNKTGSPTIYIEFYPNENNRKYQFKYKNDSENTESNNVRIYNSKDGEAYVLIYPDIGLWHVGACPRYKLFVPPDSIKIKN